MPTFRVNMNVKQKGIIFDKGATKAASRRMVISINDVLAVEGVRRVKAHLGKVLQNPTGYYESRIVVDRKKISRSVSDSNVIYGGWLEGVTSRNKSSRFKGYRTFRMVKQSLATDKVQLAKPIVDKFVREMGG